MSPLIIDTFSLKHSYSSTRQQGNIYQKTGCKLYSHRRDNLNLTQNIVFFFGGGGYDAVRFSSLEPKLDTSLPSYTVSYVCTQQSSWAMKVVLLKVPLFNSRWQLKVPLFHSRWQQDTCCYTAGPTGCQNLMIHG
jgi:hypothetical protein